MKTRLVQIGDSRGIRIPAPLIEEAGLGTEVQLRVVGSGLLIEDASAPRTGWDKAAQRLRESGDDGLLDEPLPSDFDDTGWAWE